MFKFFQYRGPIFGGTPAKEPAQGSGEGPTGFVVHHYDIQLEPELLKALETGRGTTRSDGEGGKVHVKYEQNTAYKAYVQKRAAQLLDEASAPFDEIKRKRQARETPEPWLKPVNVDDEGNVTEMANPRDLDGDGLPDATSEDHVGSHGRILRGGNRGTTEGENTAAEPKVEAAALPQPLTNFDPSKIFGSSAPANESSPGATQPTNTGPGNVRADNIFKASEESTSTGGKGKDVKGADIFAAPTATEKRSYEPGSIFGTQRPEIPRTTSPEGQRQGDTTVTPIFGNSPTTNSSAVNTNTSNGAGIFSLPTSSNGSGQKSIPGTTEQSGKKSTGNRWKPWFLRRKDKNIDDKEDKD